MTATPMNARQAADEIVITGAGLVTCLGSDRWTTWREILAGQCGVRPLTALEQNGPHSFTGGQAVDLSDGGEDPQNQANLPRETRYLKHVVHAALSDARLTAGQSVLHANYAPTRCAVVMGTTLHGMRNGGAFLRSGRFEHLEDFLANSTLQRALDVQSIGGPRITTCSACSSGLASVILGIRMLQNREADLVLAGGYDPISEYAYAGFRSMRLESEGGVRPFSRRRDGMKVAEGYACLVLERADRALRRDAKALARIIGYGEACDAFHLSRPHPDGEGAAGAMNMALAHAGLELNKVDLIVTHATGTRENDAAEYAAIHQVFGALLPNVSATAFKSHLGHTLGGAGAVELVLSAMALKEGVVPPCVGVDPAELEFDLALPSREPLRRALRHVLNLSLGFGGANACLILGNTSLEPTLTHNALTLDAHPQRESAITEPDTIKAPEESCVTDSHVVSEARAVHPHREVFITGVGVVLPGAVGNEAFVERLQLGSQASASDLPHDLSDDEIAPLVNAQRARRMSRYARLCIAATTAASQDAGMTGPDAYGPGCAVVVASLHGPAEFCEAYYRQIIDHGLEAANPSLFAEGVPNVGSAHLSTHFGITGFCQSIIGSRTAGLDALRLAATSIQRGVCERVIVCAADESTPLVSEAYDRLMLTQRSNGGTSIGMTTPRTKTDAHSTPNRRGAGAVCLILESDAAAEKRGARPRAFVTKTAGVSWPANNKRTAISRIAHLLEELGTPDGLLLGPAGNDLSGRLLRAGWRVWSRRSMAKYGLPRPLPVSTVYGHFPDVFSALPLADLSATLLTGRVPICLSQSIEDDQSTTGNLEVSEVSVVASDHASTASGARIHLASRR